MKPAWAALLLACEGSGCAARASLLDQPILSAGPAPVFGAEPAPSAPDPLRELLLQVAAVRGLEPGPTPALVVLPARELARRALQQFARDVPEAVRRAQAYLLWRLELVPAEVAFSAELELALAGQLEAFYVGAPPTLFVDRALGGAARRRALAHELVHALQDQRHALLRRLEYQPDGWDRQSALHALAEADALAVVERLGWAETSVASGAEQAELAAPSVVVPGVIACSLAAPYLDARARVSELLARGGFGAVDALLQDPPRSTHELLHPAEPRARGSSEPAPSPALAEFPAPQGFRAVYGDVLGEQSLRCVLEECAPEAVAAELAAGWAADRVSSFASGADTAIVWELTFERPALARDVASLLVTHLHLNATPRWASGAVSDWSCGAHSDSGVVGVLRQGVRLVFASRSGVLISGGCVSLERWLRGLRLPGPG